jgi:iron complex outermembrane receptor protein
VTAQSGYLQGGFTQADLSSTAPHTFEPEKLIAFTAGAKNRFFGNRLQLNDEFFYYDYRDYQLQITPYDRSTGRTVFLILNVPKSRIYGDQLDLAYSVGRNTDLTASLIYLNAKITQGFATSPNYEGFQLPNAPTLTANLALEQRFPLPDGGHLGARIASTINSGYWTVFTHADFTHQDHFTKTDINFTYYAANDHWNVGAFVRNVENSATYYGSDGGPAPGAPAATFIDAPRTYGVRAEVKF